MLSRGPIRFVLRYSFFVAACAPVLAMETAWCLDLPAPSFNLLVFLYSATLMAYNLYYVRHSDYPLSPRLAGLAAACALLFGVWSWPLSLPVLAFLCLAAAAYVAPALFRFRPPRAYLPLKPVLLATVWTLATFFLVPGVEIFKPASLLLGVYRLVFVGNLCLLFFFRDEGQYFESRTLALLWRAGLAVQLILAVASGFATKACVGEALVFGFLLTETAGQLRHRKEASNEAYLLFVDGIMLVQPIFVILLRP